MEISEQIILAVRCLYGPFGLQMPQVKGGDGEPKQKKTHGHYQPEVPRNCCCGMTVQIADYCRQLMLGVGHSGGGCSEVVYGGAYVARSVMDRLLQGGRSCSICDGYKEQRSLSTSLAPPWITSLPPLTSALKSLQQALTEPVLGDGSVHGKRRPWIVWDRQRKAGESK